MPKLVKTRPDETGKSPTNDRKQSPERSEQAKKSTTPTKSRASDNQWKIPSSGTPMETEQKNVLGLSFPPLATPRFDTPAVDSPKEPEGSKEKPMKEIVPADQPAVQGKTEVSSSNYTIIHVSNSRTQRSFAARAHVHRCSDEERGVEEGKAGTLGDLLCGRAKGPE